jgi:SAM-dependent methyltransferase
MAQNRDPDPLLDEQTEYYRKRGAVSDDWFYRRGRYDRGPILNRRWFYESVELIQALLTFELSGKVLELGGGTGFWTQHIAMSAEQVTVVDVSAESIAASRARIGSFASRVRYIETDVFSWAPNQKFDAVFSAFWLSHVPPQMFAEFWDFVHSCLKPGGRVFLIETLRSKNGIARDHRLPGKDEKLALRRRLERPYHVYKTYYTPETLRQQLGALGWETDLYATREFFMYGSAQHVE